MTDDPRGRAGATPPDGPEPPASGRIAPPTSGKGRPRWGRRALGLALGGVALILGAGAWLTASDSGLRTAAGWVEGPLAGALGGARGGEAVIEGARGSLWGRLDIAHLRLAGADGFALVIDDLRLDWRPGALFDGQLRVVELGAARVALTLPGTGPSETPEEAGPLTLPELPRPPLAVLIERLDFPDITVDPGDGTRFQARAEGTAMAGEDGRLAVRLDLSATHDGKAADRITLDATLTPPAGKGNASGAPTLALALDADLPADGLVAGLADLPPALDRRFTLALDGTAPIAAWQGDLRAESEGLARLDGTLALRDPRGETPGVGFEGGADLIDPGALALPAALAGPLALTLEVGHRARDGRLTLDRLRFAREGLARGEARGWLDPEGGGPEGGSFEAGGTLTLDSGAADLLPGASEFSAATARFDLGGTLDAPTGTLSLDIAGLDAGGMGAGPLGADRVRVDLSAEPDTGPNAGPNAGGQGGAAGRPAVLELTLTGARWPAPSLAALLGSDPAARLSTRIAPNFSALRDIRLTLDPLGLALTGGLALDAGDAGGSDPSWRVTGEELVLTLDRLAALTPVIGVPAEGAARIELSDLTAGPEGASGMLALDLSDAFLVDPAVTALLGESPGVETRAALDGAGALTLSDITARMAAGRLTGQARFPAGFETVAGEFDGTLAPSVLPLPPEIAVAGGRLDLAARLSGPLATPEARVETMPLALSIAGEELSGAALTADLAWREGGVPAVDLTARARYRDMPVRLAGHVLAAPDRLTIEGVEAEGFGAVLTGEAALPDYGLPATGGLALESGDLAGLAPLLGLDDLSGAARAEATLKTGADGAQAIDLVLTSDGAALGAARVGTARLEASLTDALALAGLDARLVLEGGTIDPIDRGKLTATLAGDLGALDLALEAGARLAPPDAGTEAMPLSLDTAGRIEGLDGAETRLTLTRAEGAAGEIPFSLAEPARLVLDEDGLAATALSLTLEGARVALDYGRGTQGIEASARIEALPLGRFLALAGQPGARARLDARLSLSEPAGEAPTGILSARLDGLSVEGVETPADIGLTLDGTLDAEGLRLTAGGDGPGIDDLDMRLRAPLRLSLAGTRAELAGDAPLDGAARVGLDLGRLWPYVPAPEHSAAGRIAIDARLGGTAAAPEMSGSATLDGARYEHLSYGTILTDIAGRIGFEDGAVTIEELTARDPEGGRVTGRGHLDLVRPMRSARAHLTLSRVRTVHTDPLRLDTDAEIDLRTPEGASRPALTGRVTVREGEVNLGAALPPSTPTLDVEEVDAPPDGEDSAEEEAAGPVVDLDLTVSIPGQLFVRGRGVDSEWEGELRIAGTSATPRVSGQLRARRGRFDVIGKSFAIGDSTIRFSGGKRVDPRLGIRGVYEADDLTVIARLQGPASDPEVVLESQPPLPRDEILSRVLFGKSKGRLTAIEAAQLAVSAAELSGGGGGFDVLGTIRQFVGVDVLQLDAGQGGAAVRAGKYIADGIYVGAKQGAAAGSTSVEVEVEVTPNISVNTEAGQNDSDVGIQFKWDY